MRTNVLRRRYGHAGGESWEVARDRLLALSATPSTSDVAYALEPIGLGGDGGFPASLVDHEAMRVLAMLNAERLKSAVLPKARIGDRYYDATELVRAVHAARGAKRAASSARSSRKAAIGSLPELAGHSLASATSLS